MKTNVPFYLTIKQFICLEKQITMKKVLLLLMFVFFYTGVSAQGVKINQADNEAIIVTELNSFLNTSSNRVSSPGVSMDAKNMKALTTDVQPSIYFYGGEEKTY